MIFFRCLSGHFRPQHHFAFEAVSWYWPFKLRSVGRNQPSALRRLLSLAAVLGVAATAYLGNWQERDHPRSTG